MASFDEEVRTLLGKPDAAGASARVIRDLGPEVLGFLSGVLGNHQDADEVFALVCVRVWHGIAGFHWRCSLRTWVYVIARNETARFRRKARRQAEKFVTPSALDDVVADVRSATWSTLRSVARDRVLALRDELSTQDRALLILRVDRELPWEEIALTFLPEEEHGSQESIRRESARLRKRFELIRKKLRRLAQEQGIVPR